MQVVQVRFEDRAGPLVVALDDAPDFLIGSNLRSAFA